MSRTIKKIISIAIITAMVIMNFNCVVLTTNAAETDEYIVITKTDKAADKIEDKYNVSTDEALNGADNVLSGTLTATQAEKLEDMKNVEVVEKDFTFEDNTEEDILPDVKPADDNWANKIVEATNTEQSGKKIKICIIDSGVDMTENFEIAERIDFINENYGEETSEEYLEEMEEDEEIEDFDDEEFDEEDFDEMDDNDEYENLEEIDEYDEDEEYDSEDELLVDDGESGTLALFDDTCGHGTSIASVIAGTGTGSDVEGIAPKAELYSAKILDENREAPVSRAVKAIYWAVDKGMDIINLSFGTTTYSAALEQAVNDAADAGILVVASVGNNGNDGIDYPARCESTLSVGAVNAASEVCDFSSKGDKVDVVAPGEAITAQANFGEDMTLTGTSLATPYVTAIAADLWSRDTSKPATFIKELIKASGKTITSEDSHEDKLIDYNYANEIYDEAYEAYLEKTGEVEDADKNANQEQNITFEETKEDIQAEIEDENTSTNEVTEEITPSENATVTKENDAKDEIQENGEKKEIKEENDIKETVNEDKQEETIEIDLTEEIEENTEEPQDLAEDKVKGSWGNGVHQMNVEAAKMKAGAIYPDDPKSPVRGMTKHSIFHGRTTDTFGVGADNYVAAYRYMALVAKEYTKEYSKQDPHNYKNVKYDDATGLSKKRYNEIYDFFEKLHDGKLKGSASGFKEWTRKQKANFIYGIAMHEATDPFAHSVFKRKVKKNKKTKKKKIIMKWFEHTHEAGEPCRSDCCDYRNYYPHRADMALEIENNIVDRAEGDRNVGYARDFYVGMMSNTSNYKYWRINKLYTFADAAGLGNDLKTIRTYFKEISKKITE